MLSSNRCAACLQVLANIAMHVRAAAIESPLDGALVALGAVEIRAQRLGIAHRGLLVLPKALGGGAVACSLQQSLSVNHQCRIQPDNNLH